METGDERDTAQGHAGREVAPSLADIEQRYGAMVSRLARRFFRRQQDAEEAVQEAYSRLPFLLEKYNNARPFLPWLKVVLGRFFLDCLRIESAEIQRRRTLQGRLISAAEKKQSNPEAQAQRQEILLRLRRRLDELSPTDRALLIMCAEQGEALATAAEVVGLSRDAARNRLFRLRQMLRREFADAAWEEANRER